MSLIEIINIVSLSMQITLEVKQCVTITLDSSQDKNSEILKIMKTGSIKSEVHCSFRVKCTINC